ncbi:MAG: adenine phosphoribosyltransferase [Gammaproteobacteria bacterium]
MNIDHIAQFIVDVPDFPEPGVVFKDITPLLANPAAFSATVDLLAGCIRQTGADEVLAIESRGFIFGSAVATRLSLPLHLVRKPGKLPRDTVGHDYALEYGTDRVEIHSGTLRAGLRCAIVDDVIATGGTAAATARLVRDQGAEIVGCCVVIELGFLNGRDRLDGCPVDSLITYD